MQVEPEFTTDPNVSEITAEVIQSIHRKAGPSIKNDSDFVYESMRYVFKELLQVQTLMGSIVEHRSKVPERINVLDKGKVNYLYEQYRIRVMAVGINSEERTTRAQENVFRRYVSNLTKCEHTKRASREKQAQLL